MSDELGVGIVYFQALAPLVEEPGAVDVLEVEPQVFWLPSDGPERYRDDGAALRWLRDLPFPRIAHGVGYPIGGVAPPSTEAVDRFARDVRTLDARWASEHLSFARAHGPDGEFEAGFLLPPRQTLAAARRSGEHIRAFAARLPVPFAIETGVNYLRPRADELSDGRFVAEVAEAGDCGILLDLHNLFANERNGRQPVREFLAEIPLERVVEVHVAGGEWHRGYWLDGHSDLVPAELIALVREVLPSLPSLRAMLFEILADHVPRVTFPAIRRQIDDLRRLWDRRTRAARRPSPPPAPAIDALPNDDDARAWENALAALVNGRTPDGPFAEALAADPGVPIVRDLVESQRAGAAVDSLRLTTRLLRLTLGDERLMDELRAFWETCPPALFGADEGAALGAFLATRTIDIPHFGEVLAYERALLRLHRGSSEEIVHFACDPGALLGALAERRLAGDLAPCDVELRLGPEGSVSLVG